jgi:hypothetical protein
MKVLAGPRLDLEHDEAAGATARALAGPGGVVLSLRQVGVSNLSRTLTTAEVALLREAMTGDAPADGGGAAGGGPEAGAPPGQAGVVGYVCRGTSVGTGAALTVPGNHPARLVAVTDHANLTWRSPLTGPNDDSVGPRFPSMTGIYVPEIVADRLEAAEGMIVVPGVVAGVRDDGCLNAFEAETARAQGYAAASSELVPVAIVAAHLGLRVAGVVLIAGSSGKGDG